MVFHNIWRTIQITSQITNLPKPIFGLSFFCEKMKAAPSIAPQNACEPKEKITCRVFSAATYSGRGNPAFLFRSTILAKLSSLYFLSKLQILAISSCTRLSRC